jgi:hypothetical protein
MSGYGIGGTVEQAASWAAAIVRMRAAEPVGRDVEALKAWHEDDTLTGQFVPTAGAAAEALAPAAWAVLAATGGLGVLPPGEHDTPNLISVDLGSGGIFPDGMYRVNYKLWPDQPGVVFWEAIPQHSTDGVTWTDVPGSPIQRWVDAAFRQDPQNGRPYGGWLASFDAAAVPGVNYYRIQVRVRNRSFGEWTTSNISSIVKS